MKCVYHVLINQIKQQQKLKQRKTFEHLNAQFCSHLVTALSVYRLRGPLCRGKSLQLMPRGYKRLITKSAIQ